MRGVDTPRGPILRKSQQEDPQQGAATPMKPPATPPDLTGFADFASEAMRSRKAEAKKKRRAPSAVLRSTAAPRMGRHGAAQARTGGAR